MAIKLNTKLCLLFVLTLSLFLLPSHCRTKYQEEEEESAEEALFNCFLRCTRPRDQNQRELSDCEQVCLKRYQDTKKAEEREEEGSGSGSGGGGIENHHAHQDPVQQYKQCQSRCGRQEKGQQRQYCQQKCQWQYEKQKRQEQGREHGGGGDVTDEEILNKAGKERRKEQEESNNPYFFDSQRFDSKYRTEQGHIKVLERFSKKSDLLQGIENYRLAVLEANPNTFVLPHHCDAESVFFVVGGKGTISYVWKNQRKSYNLERGYVIRVHAGSIVYLTNQDDNERLYILKLLQPVNTPGKFKEYFGVGGDNPESFYTSFSNEILEAAFNTQAQKLERLFGQQSKGVIIKASKEQIRALSQESESESSSRGRTEEQSCAPFNLLNKPSFSNEFGQFFEASPHDYQQLKDMDVSVKFININKGGMIAPYYNSKSTRLVFVVGGSGHFEMACPHLAGGKHGSQGRKEKQGEIITDAHYHKVSSRLSVGDAFVVPAGHPIAIVASQDSNLQLAGFGIKASHNQKYFLAGQGNVWEQVESEAKELAFKIPAREVEEILGGQEQSYFLPGPGQQGQGRQQHSRVASILDFVGF